MKTLLTLLTYLFLNTAFAGMTLQIEHPRYPANVSDVFKIECLQKCSAEVRTTNLVSKDIKLKDMTEMISKLDIKASEVPVSDSESIRFLYRIRVKRNGKESSYILQYPLLYSGEEYVKYASMINTIEEIKREIKKDTGNKP